MGGAANAKGLHPRVSLEYMRNRKEANGIRAGLRRGGARLGAEKQEAVAMAQLRQRSEQGP